jgi:LPS-assembly protein
VAANNRGNIKRRLTVLLASAAVCVNVMHPVAAYAQDSSLMSPVVADDAKMLLRANELVYNQDAERVTATGGVQIYYNRYRMVAQRVEYNQQTMPRNLM